MSVPSRVILQAEKLIFRATNPEAELALVHLHRLLRAHPDLERELPTIFRQLVHEHEDLAPVLDYGLREPLPIGLPDLAGAPYRVIVADPAWRFSDTISMSKVKRGADAQYDGTMSLNEICRLPVEDLADEDAILVLWYPDAMPGEALEVMRRWGFRQTQQWRWIKTGIREQGLPEILDSTEPLPPEADLAFLMGRLARNCCEQALVGVRGKIYDHLRNKSIRSVFFAPNEGHSKKPECVQDALELMFPEGNRLELFARRQRPGWDCLGNECPATLCEDLRDSMARVAPVQTAPDQMALFGVGG